jgi:phosphatidate phosphatase APP1
MIKGLVHRLALRIEAAADRVWGRTSDGRAIDPFIGYATPDHLVLRGRVLSKLRHASPVSGQSRFANFRQILRMFLTDEVRDATVRCGDVTAVTDEEGYFTLLLPRDGRTGWITELVQVEGAQDSVTCPVFVPHSQARFIVVSDIDDTMIETGAYSLMRNLYTSFTGNATTRHVFADAVALMENLSDKGRNPVYYVSSSPWNLHGFLADVFRNSGLVRGPMFLRDLGLSTTKFITDSHGNHKGASIDVILGANPELPVILLGDTGQHDAQIYRDVIDRHPGRIIAVGLRTPGSGMDAADRADLQAIADTGVHRFAERDFNGMYEELQSLRPDRFPASQPAERRRAISQN